MAPAMVLDSAVVVQTGPNQERASPMAAPHPSPTVTLRGASGASYTFQVFAWGTAFKSLGAVYVVLRTATDGIIYIGQTGDLSERFDNHHKAPCFSRYGRTHIGVLMEGLESRRLAIETDLVRAHQPPCNGQ